MFWIDVDAALTELPVNVLPLIDDTDFKTKEEGIVYNQAGMDLVWNFTTTAGVTTQTAVTPTTAGVYDWTHQGNAQYTIEVPASGGISINNDTEGFGWFTGVCTGVLPWSSPIFGFRAAALNNALIDGGDELDVNVTKVSDTAQTANDNGADINTLITRLIGTIAAGTHNPQGGDNYARLGAPAGASVSADNAAIKAETAVIVIDTNELQTDWTNGGRLDLLIDAIKVITDALPNSGALTDLAQASVVTEVRLSELDAGTAGKAANQIDIIQTDTTTDIPASITALNNLSAAQVNAEIDTALVDFFTSSAQLVDDIWDELLSGHNVGGTTGKALKNAADFVITDGTAQAGGVGQITLAAGESAVDNQFTHQTLIITSGTGAGQARIVIHYHGSTKVAEIAPNWVTTPDNTSVYQIVPGIVHAGSGWSTLHEGYAQGGSLTTITLSDEASSIDDFYNNQQVIVHSGTGAGQVRVVTDYNGTTKVATLNSAWPTATDITSQYLVNADGHAPYVADVVLDELLSGHVIAGSLGKAIADIEADTNELQTDWADGGRLDLLIDSIIAETVTASGEPAQGIPPVSASMGTKINYMFKAWRNKTTQTADTHSLYNDAGDTVDHKSTDSDDGTTATKGEMGSGA